jgi:NAD(P)-dependent dehydrogenase (short-subunit alcohol dehydrogenase family)
MNRVLIVGGYGAFGAHAAERLARTPGLEIVIAGRSRRAATEFCDRLAPAAKAALSAAQLDAMRATPDEIGKLGARVLINASGPFQEQGYDLARACIAARCHYIDLADARSFVTGIGALDAAAKSAGVAVISGASSVPGLSSAVVRDHANTFSRLHEIEIGISPGNSFDPGLATTASILAQVGKPYTLRSGGREATAFGWQGLRRHRFPGIGARLMCNVDVPDIALLPERYPELRTAHFSAGLEVAPFHLGLWGLSWLVRSGIVSGLTSLAGPLLRAKRALGFLGSDAGGMFVTMRGLGRDNDPRELRWTLIARSGHGPYVPAIASVILARRLSGDLSLAAGARACFGLFATRDFTAETADLDIEYGLEQICGDEHCNSVT